MERTRASPGGENQPVLRHSARRQSRPTSAGTAIRLYPESDFVRRPTQIAPEITRSDLSPTVLQLAAHGLRFADLNWLDAPSDDLLAHAYELLNLLGALKAGASISALGQRMAALPVHPRLARFLLAAASREACDIAARLSEGRFRLPDSGSFASDIEALLASEIPYSTRRLRQQLAGRSAHDKGLSSNRKGFASGISRPGVARKRGSGLLYQTAHQPSWTAPV